jgi:hypothetical protein
MVKGAFLPASQMEMVSLSISLLVKDTRQLMCEVRRMGDRVKIIEQTHTGEAGTHSENNLRQILEDVRGLDLALNILLLDCIFLGRRYWKDYHLPLIKSLHRCWDAMNQFIESLKNLCSPGVAESVDSSELKEMVMNWHRIEKCILQIEKAAEYPQKRRKNSAWLSSDTGRSKLS